MWHLKQYLHSILVFLICSAIFSEAYGSVLGGWKSQWEPKVPQNIEINITPGNKRKFVKTVLSALRDINVSRQKKKLNVIRAKYKKKKFKATLAYVDDFGIKKSARLGPRHWDLDYFSRYNFARL